MKSQGQSQACGKVSKWVWGHLDSTPKELRRYTIHKGRGGPPGQPGALTAREIKADSADRCIMQTGRGLHCAC